jgi:phosphate starvation-inducible PhoH-like protein
MVTKKIFLRNSDEVVHLLGQQDENLRRLEQAYGVQIFVRQGRQAGDFSLVVRGGSGKVDSALAELQHLRERRKEPAVHGEERQHPPAPASYTDTDIFFVTGQGKPIRPRTEHQRIYLEAVDHYDLVIGIGPA